MAEKLPRHQKHSDTSKAAAKSMVVDQTAARQKVLDAIKKAGAFGATDEELTGIPMGANTVRPRRCELKDRGLVVDSGLRRKGKSGRKFTVWVHVDYKPSAKFMSFEEKLKALGVKDLSELYRQDAWKLFKEDYYSRNPKRCFVTGVTRNLELHHTTYENLGNERDGDVKPLHSPLHELLHEMQKKYKLPLDKMHLIAKDLWEFFKDADAR